MPRGFWTWRWSSSFFQYSSQVEGQLQSFRTSGTNWTHKGEIERLLWRDQVSKTHARVSVSVKDARNYLEETKLDTSSRILSVLRGEVSHTRQMLGGSLTLLAGLDQGTTWFGAARDRQAEPGAPRAQFLKSDGEVSFLRGWQIGGVQVMASTRLAAQYSPDLLWSSEQLSLGGSSTVRGFDSQSLSAVNGLYNRNELSVTPPLIPGELAKYAGQLSLLPVSTAAGNCPDPAPSRAGACAGRCCWRASAGRHRLRRNLLRAGAPRPAFLHQRARAAPARRAHAQQFLSGVTACLLPCPAI
ncbi:ShlB/FhaC/HecB family hemolysin secretion/activation protein [Pannonibacter sp. Pt2-lr]